MMQILDNEKEQKILPLFRLAFRPFFLAASAFSVVAMLMWALFWSGKLSPVGWMYNNPIWWHGHEMLFGFTGAIIVGFLLTAVQNWTGNPGVRGGKLAFIFGLWLVARIAFLFASPHWVWMVIDLLWMPLAAYFLAVPILIRKQWNNLFFVPLIVLMTALNALYHLNVLNAGILPSFLSTHALAMMAVMVISLIVLIVGGRVIPFFTWRGTQSEPISRIKGLELAALIPTWLLLFNVLLPVPDAINQVSLPVLLTVTALCHLVRFLRWRTLSTCRVPLLWLLHFAYLATIVGLLLLALYHVNGAVSESIALHMLTVGGIGCMILAMIARVSLGHTGRNLQIGRWVILAFVTLVLATLTRTAMIYLWPALTIQGYIISAILWAVAFAIFTVVYYPVLTQPRVDGRPG